MNPVTAVTQFVKLALMDSSDEEESLQKVEGYAENTVPYMPNKQFRQHFRMEPETFENLLRQMGSVLKQEKFNHTGYPRNSLEKEALVTIWYLGNMESFRYKI